jgi:sodium-coupled neutral amino acid transporter 11
MSADEYLNMNNNFHNNDDDSFRRRGSSSSNNNNNINIMSDNNIMRDSSNACSSPMRIEAADPSTSEYNNNNDNNNNNTSPSLSTPKKQSSILGASSNLVNSIVGAGIIGIPYALRMSGLVAGTFLLLLVAIMTDKSLRLLIEQTYFHPKLKRLNIRTYEELATYPFGTLGSGFVLASMFIMAYGAMVAYLLIIKDTVPTALWGYDHGTHMFERNMIVLFTSLVIVVPLSMQRDMASLSCSSAVSVAADIVLVIYIAAYSPVKETVEANGGIGAIMKNDGVQISTLFIGLGILSTAMACQHSAHIVGNSLSNKTRLRWRWVTNQSIALSTILCLTLGLAGYLGFLNMTAGDVLNNFAHDSKQANAARLLLAFTMFLTYPMESFVARHVLVMLMHNGDMDAHGHYHHESGGGGFALENEERIEIEEFGEGGDGCAVLNGETKGTNGKEGGGLLCMNRRQTWTVAIYLVSASLSIFTIICPIISLY